MDFKERIERVKEALEELKDDIATLNRNIEEVEEILDSVNSEEELRERTDLDIEHGLNHIRLF